MIKKSIKRALQASGLLRTEHLTQYANLRRAKSVLEAIQQDPKLRRIQAGSYHNLPLGLATNPFRAFPSLFSRQSPYKHRTQRPNFYLPGLEAKPWWPTDEHSKALVENLPVIEKEFQGVVSRMIGHPQKNLVNTGSWLTFPLFRSEKIEDNCLLCPKTTKIVESLPLCHQVTGVVYFSVLVPGTKIKPHCGPANTRIRYHLTLSSDEQAWMRIGTERRYWKNGECLVFDDSFEHEVQHVGDAPRVVLLVDCWHPGLSALEREWITNLYARIS